MAIEPIQQFREPSNSLLQVLQGGSQAITGILDRAIQIGRDMSDKRTRQEQDLIGMRLAETNLAQRRGEELQQNIEDAQRFAQNAYQFERKFGADQQNLDRNFNRVSAQDVLQQQNADRSYGLSERRVVVDEATAKARADEAALEQKRLENMATLPGTATAPATTATPSPETVLTSPQGRIPWKAGTDRAFVKGELVTPQNDTGIPWANPNSAFPTDSVQKQESVVGIPTLLARPEATPAATGVLPDKPTSTVNEADLLVQLEQAQIAKQAAAKLGDPARLQAAVKAEAAAQAELNKFKRSNSATVNPNAARDQQMQEERFAAQKEKTATTQEEKQMRQLVEGDTTSFLPQTTWLAREADRVGKDKLTEAQKAEATAFDKDRFASEVATAARMTETEYVSKGPSNPRAQAARKKLWNFANKTSTPASGTPGAVSRIPGI